MEFNFTPSIDAQPGVLFEPSSWLAKIDFINQFITNNHVLISILGEKGSGKTTFIDVLKRKINPDIETVIWTAVPLFDRNACLQQLAELFDLKNLSGLEELKKIIDERQVETLLIIDDAEQLSESFICEMLDTIRSQSDHSYFHLCIVSDFSLVKTTSRLARETYKEMIHSIELQPLSQQETKEYVIDRLGWSHEQAEQMSQDRFKQFYDLTEGNLVGINSQMHGFFAEHKSHVHSSRTYFSYGLMVLAVFAVAGFTFFMHHQSGKEDISATSTPIESAKVEIELPYQSQIPSLEVASIRESLELKEQPQETLIVADELQGPQNSNSNNQDQHNSSFPDEPIKVKAHKEIKEKEVIIQAKNNLKPTKPAKIKKATITASVAQRYTIQLLAGRNEAQVRKFQKQHPQLKNTHVATLTQNGVVWYVLTMGEYNYRQGAQTALINISKNLRDVKPWVRSMDHLKRIG